MKNLVLIFSVVFSSLLIAQEMSFEEYDPPSTLVVPETKTTQAKYPFIDVHSHQWRIPEQDLQLLARQMDSLNMGAMVNLSGRSFERIQITDSTFEFRLRSNEFLAQSIEKIKKEIPGKVITFTNVDFDGFGESGWAERVIREIELDYNNGARGLKIYKSLGMDTKVANGNRVAIDDSRINPVWEKCAELGIPVLIHSADPAPFWHPHDENNERWLELKEIPRRKRDLEKYPTWEQIIKEQHNLFRNHPNTKFINAHLGWLGNDLTKLGELFDELPNVYAGIGAVIAELGRQPRFARKFLIKYQDRILFGKDSYKPEEFSLYFRVLETDDDYIKYFRRRHAFWRLYGLDLPDEVLKKIYYRNAINVIPGIDRSLFPD